MERYGLIMSIIGLKKEKCVGCNACVRACPAGDANIAHIDDEGILRIEIDDSKCIKCGACITACSNNARYFKDDIDQFLSDLKANVVHVLLHVPIMHVISRMI